MGMKKKPNDRDMFGTPKNRSKTWDAKKTRDPKKDRRESKREPNGIYGHWAKKMIEDGAEVEDDIEKDMT